VDGLVDFAEEQSTTITFESVNEGVPMFQQENQNQPVDTRLKQRQEKAVFQHIWELKKNHYAINNSRDYLRMFKEGNVNYHCHAPKIGLRIYPDGNVVNCMDRAHPLGNAYEEPLQNILSSPRMKYLQQKAESCSACLDSGAIESSMFWEMSPAAMLDALRLFLKK
jgi:MoaA/NifB/PqqE/SkfB family radical SAM enzyme